MKESNPWLYVPVEIRRQFVYDIIIKSTPIDSREYIIEEDISNPFDILESVVDPFIENLKPLKQDFMKSPILD